VVPCWYACRSQNPLPFRLVATGGETGGGLEEDAVLECVDGTVVGVELCDGGVCLGVVAVRDSMSAS
jgi:hypothetical protein